VVPSSATVRAILSAVCVPSVRFRPSCCRSFTIVARLKADAGEIIWTGIRIYETKIVQRLLTRRSGSSIPSVRSIIDELIANWCREQRTDDGSLLHQLLPNATIHCRPLHVVPAER